MTGPIRLARAEEVALLDAIEDAADTLFATVGVELDPRAEWHDDSLYADAQRDDRLFVSVDAADRPVGFACLAPLDGVAHLEELSVHPDHGRRGRGSALVERAIAWARAHGLPALTLSTFRHVPWNAPFYARLGFRELPPEELTPGLLARRATERRNGLDLDERCCMRLELGPP